VRAEPIEEAVALAAAGRRDEAIARLRGALQSLPRAERPRATYLLATWVVDWESAEPLYVEVARELDRSRWTAPALLRLGEYAFLGGDPVRAGALFAEASGSALSPEDRALALYREAQALLAMDRTSEARARLRLLLDEGAPPDLHDRAVLTLASCAYGDGDYGEALRHSLSISQRGGVVAPQALLTAAQSLLARGERGLALQYFDELARSQPDTPSGAIARSTADSLRASAGPAVVPGPREEPPVVSARPDSSRPPAPEPAATRPVPSAAPPDLKTVPGPGGDYYVQLGAFERRDRAIELLSRLRRRGIATATVHRTASPERALFRVRIGPFATRAAADSELVRLEALTSLEGFVLEGE
jgi:cell division septation protein DedD